MLMITHNEQWLTAYPAFEFRCAGGRLSIDKGGIQTTVAESTAVEVAAPIAPAVEAAVATPADEHFVAVEAAVAVAAVAEPAPAAVIEPAPAAVAGPIDDNDIQTADC